MSKQLPESTSTKSNSSFCQNCGYPSHCGIGHTTKFKDYEVDGGTIREVLVCKHCNCNNCSPKKTKKDMKVKANNKLF